MKHILSKLLCTLLVAVFLFSPVAIAEEEVEAVEAVETIEEIEEVEAVEPVDEIVEEQSVEIVEEDTLGGNDEVYTYAGEHYDAAPSDMLYAAAGEIPIDAAHFPDATFLGKISGFFDLDHNGSLSAAEIANVTAMENMYQVNGVGDLTGIKYFTSLQTLEIYNSTFTSLDVSGMTSLKKIKGYLVPLTSLNVSGCASLEEIGFDGNVKLASLDVSGLASLKKLGINSWDPSTATLVAGYGPLTSLNLSGCTSLEGLTIRGNSLTYLDVSGMTSLKELNCGNNQLTGVNVSGCTSLMGVSLFGNQLTSIGFLKGFSNLEYLYVDNNKLSGALDLRGYPKLRLFECTNNALTSLNLSGLSNLYTLACENNKIKTLDISGSKKLIKNYKSGKHTKENGAEKYHLDTGWGYDLSFDSGVKITTASKSSKSSSSSKTKLASKKLKVTAYVGTPIQMDTNGETGKSFKSSNKKIATVNSKGLVTPKKAGKCKITYKTSSASYTVTLTVKDLTIPKWVVLNLKGTIAAKVGEPQTLTATMNDGAVSKFKWTTSNKKIATVKNGVVTFKKKGTVTITVTTVKGKKKAKVKFKVSK